MIPPSRCTIMPAVMNGFHHRKIVTLALAALPPDSRAFWAPLEADLLSTCMLPDEKAIALLNGATGPWRRFFPPEVPRHSFEKKGSSARAHFFDTRFYVRAIAERLAAGDLPEAARFLGVLSHCLADYAEPAHYLEAEITLLLPPPADRLNCNPHRMIEDVRSAVEAIAHAPRPLGRTAETVVLRLEGRLRDLYELAMATAILLLAALYRRDEGEAAGLSGRVVAACAGVMADLLHTFRAIHAESWTPEEQAALAVCRLDDLEPADYDVEFNFGMRPLRGGVTPDSVGHALPLALYRNGAIEPVEGLCVVPHALPIKGTEYKATLDYDLPAGAFSRFTAGFGLLAGFRPQAVCRFSVEGDGRTLFASPPVAPGDPAGNLAVAVRGVRRLRLAVHTDGSTDKLAFPVWAFPTLEE